MTDDFLFDPWYAGGADAASPSTETTGDDEKRTVGERKLESAHAEGTGEARVAPSTRQPRRWVARSGPGEAPRQPPSSLPSSSPSDPFHSIPDHPRLPGEDQPSSLAKRLRAMAVPRIQEMATRLRAARHRTLLDDRLDRSVPVLRFRLIPWEGPFDEAPKVAGSVFELVVAESDAVTARRWLDPVAETPEAEAEVDAGKLDEAWIDRQLMSFVEKSLRRG